jgi:heat shock protein HslJ
MNLGKSVILILLAIAFLTACGNISENGTIDLDGTSWKLVSYDGISPIEGKLITANFAQGEIDGSASCNHYFGSYKIKGNQITIEGLGWTEMACLDPEGIMEQEQQVMNLLSKAASIQVDSTQLSIVTSSGKNLEFISLDQ